MDLYGEAALVNVVLCCILRSERIFDSVRSLCSVWYSLIYRFVILHFVYVCHSK